MRAIARLRHDHDLFRRQLAVLESVLHEAPETWAVLRESCGWFSKQLRDHIRRERRLAVCCSRRLGRFGSAELARLAVEHDTDQAFLHVIKRGLADGARFSLDAIRPAATSFIIALHRHMAEQETELFPLIERLLIGSGGGRSLSPGPWEALPRYEVLPLAGLSRSRRFFQAPLSGIERAGQGW